VEISFASFATIADVVLPAKTRKNSFRPSKKTSRADLYLTSLLPYQRWRFLAQQTLRL
jgi:hypothetical protein